MQVESQVQLVKRPKVWKLVLNIALPIALIAIFAWQVHKNWSDISKHPITVNWPLTLLAVLVLILNSFFEILIWNRTLGWFTDSLPFSKVAPVYVWSSLARYVPGKVVSLLVRVDLAKEAGRDIVPVLASSTVELALRTASGLLVLLVAVMGWGIAAKGSMLYLPLIIVPLVLICAHPRIMLPVMNWVLCKIKQQPIERSLRYREVLGIFALTLVRWIVYGAAFGLLAVALYPESRQHLPVLVGTAAGSWAGGFVGISPGGVGVSEGIQMYILGLLHFPMSVIFGIPVLFRVSTLAAEGFWALVSLPMWRKK
jgi:uncharacterized membrane protein YbhN (UPF0104 family)